MIKIGNIQTDFVKYITDVVGSLSLEELNLIEKNKQELENRKYKIISSESAFITI